MKILPFGATLPLLLIFLPSALAVIKISHHKLGVFDAVPVFQGSYAVSGIRSLGGRAIQAWAGYRPNEYHGWLFDEVKEAELEIEARSYRSTMGLAMFRSMNLQQRPWLLKVDLSWLMDSIDWSDPQWNSDIKFNVLPRERWYPLGGRLFERLPLWKAIEWINTPGFLQHVHEANLLQEWKEEDEMKVKQKKRNEERELAKEARKQAMAKQMEIDGSDEIIVSSDGEDLDTDEDEKEKSKNEEEKKDKSKKDDKEDTTPKPREFTMLIEVKDQVAVIKQLLQGHLEEVKVGEESFKRAILYLARPLRTRSLQDRVNNFILNLPDSKDVNRSPGLDQLLLDISLWLISQLQPTRRPEVFNLDDDGVDLDHRKEEEDAIKKAMESAAQVNDQTLKEVGIETALLASGLTFKSSVAVAEKPEKNQEVKPKKVQKKKSYNIDGAEEEEVGMEEDAEHMNIDGESEEREKSQEKKMLDDDDDEAEVDDDPDERAAELARNVMEQMIEEQKLRDEENFKELGKIHLGTIIKSLALVIVSPKGNAMERYMMEAFKKYQPDAFFRALNKYLSDSRLTSTFLTNFSNMIGRQQNIFPTKDTVKNQVARREKAKQDKETLKDPYSQVTLRSHWNQADEILWVSAKTLKTIPAFSKKTPTERTLGEEYEDLVLRGVFEVEYKSSKYESAISKKGKPVGFPSLFHYFLSGECPVICDIPQRGMGDRKPLMAETKQLVSRAIKLGKLPESFWPLAYHYGVFNIPLEDPEQLVNLLRDMPNEFVDDDFAGVWFESSKVLFPMKFKDYQNSLRQSHSYPWPLYVQYLPRLCRNLSAILQSKSKGRKEELKRNSSLIVMTIENLYKMTPPAPHVLDILKHDLTMIFKTHVDAMATSLPSFGSDWMIEMFTGDLKNEVKTLIATLIFKTDPSFVVRHLVKLSKFKPNPSQLACTLIKESISAIENHQLKELQAFYDGIIRKDDHRVKDAIKKHLDANDQLMKAIVAERQKQERLRLAEAQKQKKLRLAEAQRQMKERLAGEREKKLLAGKQERLPEKQQQNELLGKNKMQERQTDKNKEHLGKGDKQEKKRLLKEEKQERLPEKEMQ